MPSPASGNISSQILTGMAFDYQKPFQTNPLSYPSPVLDCAAALAINLFIDQKLYQPNLSWPQHFHSSTNCAMGNHSSKIKNPSILRKPREVPSFPEPDDVFDDGVVKRNTSAGRSKHSVQQIVLSSTLASALSRLSPGAHADFVYTNKISSNDLKRARCFYVENAFIRPEHTVDLGKFQKMHRERQQVWWSNLFQKRVRFNSTVEVEDIDGQRHRTE